MSDQDLPSAGARGDNYVQAGAGVSEPAPTKEVASQEAKSVAQDTKSSASDVAGTAQEQVGDVVNEATQQLKTLFDQLKNELGGHGSDQQKRLATGLSSLADELDGMARGGEQSGIASDLARQASTRTRDAATWMENREPGEVVEEVKRFARRRPGAFLAAAAVVGLVAGRVTRGIADEARDDGNAGTGQEADVQLQQPSGYASPAGHYGIGEQYAQHVTTDQPYDGSGPGYGSEPGFAGEGVEPTPGFGHQSPRPPQELR
jgi:cell division septum initiation protein DivIVA